MMEKVVLKEGQVDRLRQGARDAMDRAYCPYSQFPVGAALLVESGEIVLGCNVESASYGGTICAERSAICSAMVCIHL